MAYEFKKHAMADGRRFGPTEGGRYYNPAGYHAKVKKNIPKKGKKAKAQEHVDKGHWVLDNSEQYDVFLEGEKHDLIDKEGMFSLLDDCKVVMGQDDERLAFFPLPPEGTEDWHGYPVTSKDKHLSDEMIDKFHEKEIVGFANYGRLQRRDL